MGMVAFAGNSLLCRQALHHTGIDAASFTLVRLAAGAAMLALIVRLRDGRLPRAGNWPSALALFVYAAGFSFAYLGLPAGTGALLLFGAVQVTMIGAGMLRGARLLPGQWLGLGLALAGLVGLLAPGLSAPPLRPAVLMAVAGAAWGVYSLRGRGGGDPTALTAGNFARASVFALLLGALFWRQAAISRDGLLLAVVSGALTSGVGYAVWYTALRGLAAASAASVQLSVPVLAALGGVILLGEPLTLRLLLAAPPVLGGIALVIAVRR
jgi:drug/metabolite transporter (DMT)-like permease